MLTIRSYKSSDFSAILDLINAAAAADKTRRISEMTLRDGLNGLQAHHRTDETVVATFGDRPDRPDRPPVVGFMWWEATSSDNIQLEGWVHPGARRKGVGTALLTAVESYARRRLPYVDSVTLSARGYADIPGFQELFQLRGFTLSRRFYVMSTTLTGHAYDVDVPEGITLRSFSRDNLDVLVEADNEIFADHWGSQRRTVQSWKYQMVDTRPHDPGLWIVAWFGDTVVGECLCHPSREGGPQDGWVAIVGVRREWRGHGLGRAVLAYGLKTLQQAGYKTASLHVDAENTAAVNLYRSLEMDVTRTRLHFVRTLTR